MKQLKLGKNVHNFSIESNDSLTHTHTTHTHTHTFKGHFCKEIKILSFHL
jgi:hypothetical protein